MKKFIKLASIFVLGSVTAIGFYIGYTFFWSVKYKVGDCITNDATVYFIDSDGPLLKGRYGVIKLPKASNASELAIPRERIERPEWRKIECPAD
jgi:hypothetical protein